MNIPVLQGLTKGTTIFHRCSCGQEIIISRSLATRSPKLIFSFLGLTKLYFLLAIHWSLMQIHISIFCRVFHSVVSSGGIIQCETQHLQFEIILIWSWFNRYFSYLFILCLVMNKFLFTYLNKYFIFWAQHINKYYNKLHFNHSYRVSASVCFHSYKKKSRLNLQSKTGHKKI